MGKRRTDLDVLVGIAGSTLASAAMDILPVPVF
jgi:hypothetical protein